VDAYKELESFLAKYPEARVVDEARNALGDCYLALGEVERALGAFAQTSKADLALFDYAWFRCGKAYRALEDYGKFQSHFETFLKERDNSPRVAEAIGQLAWLYRNQGRIEQARDLYWNAIERYGHDPEAGAVEELFLTVAKYYGNPESQKTFLNRLANLAEDAADKKPALAARARWMRARFFAKTDLKASQDELLRIPELGPPHEFSARALADIADALRAKGRAKDAEEWYWTLLRWHPQSLLKDRAWAGLGLLAREQGKNKKALEYFNLFEKKTTGSPLLADVLQARASIYEERSDWESAVAQLGRVLELPNAGSRAKAETLYRMGELYLRGGNPKQAIGCFQRIYVMYRRWEDVMVKAYWQSGRAFESLNMPTEAAGTYKELLLHTHLEKKPEYAMAQKRLNEIGIP
jgi:tetratricopeptide (TPR) repeat protein